nr:RNA-directed DNA polymerase, eukaryota [Tanacetum cinerariifolium]
MLWEYLMHVMASWKGDVIIIGDFNEVWYSNESFRSNFNVKGANAFNSFIIQAGLKEIPFGGCSFTWCHKSGSKMSKLDRFLISECLLSVCPTLSSITLDRFLSDHRPILLRESTYDYGPSPFWFFKYWAEVDGFKKLIVKTWSDNAACGSNDMLNPMYKLKNLKKKIRGWNSMRQSFKNSKIMLKSKLVDVELVIDKGNASEERMDMEADVTIKEIKNTVWDCGTNKSPGPDGFSFDFYRRFWSMIQKDVVAAVKCFFHYGSIPKGCNSSFIALIPKIPDAKMVKDFRPISLIGRLYKIIAKILANRLVTVLGDNVVDAGMFKGIVLNSSMVLSHMASGLSMNMFKSKIIGIAVNGDKVDQVAHRIGCGILEVPFTYLGSKVRG